MLLVRKPTESVWRSPTAATFSDEQTLQTLVAQALDGLPITAGGPLAVVSDLTVGAAGAIDVFGIDLNGNLTLVECRLKVNPEIRHQVIGQMLANATSLWGVSYEALDDAFAARQGESLIQYLTRLAGDDWDAEKFRAEATANLTNGRCRLVIAVDEITEELKRVVRYLNQHTSNDLQVLALELGYIADESVEILLPVVYGEEGAPQKAVITRRRWNEESMFTTLGESCSAEGLQAARRLYKFAQDHQARFYWGEGPLPWFTAQFEIKGQLVSVFSIGEFPKGRVVFAVNFQYLRDVYPEDTLADLADSLQVLPGVGDLFEELEQASFNKRPNFPIDQILAQEGAVETIEQALNELLQAEVKSGTEGPTEEPNPSP